MFLILEFLMKLIDISWPIHLKITEYKDRKSLQFTPVSTFDKDEARSTDICFNAHTGTHVDAPSHFLKDGKSIEGYNLKQLIGPCMVLDLSNVTEKITAQDLKDYDIQPDDIVLLKTKNSALNPDGPFQKEFVYVDSSAADFLAKKNIKAVGIDYLGFERTQPNHESHKAILSKNIPIIEGLRLAHVKEGEYFLWCLPLKLEGIEAAPARAILWDIQADN